MQRLARTYICLCVSIWHQCVCMYFHYLCSPAHATDYLCLPSWHRLRICIDIGFACVSTSASHYLDIGCAYSRHRLRINSNNLWNPTYLNSRELPNSRWHRLRINLTHASHSAWLRLRIVLDRLYKFKIGYLDIGFAFVLTSASHYLEPDPIWYSRLSETHPNMSAIIRFDIGFAE